jgi:hypothetical protein
MKFDPSILLKGDTLLYFDKRSIVDWIIALKTWSKIAHVEIYVGQGMSVASRNGIGVNRYALRTDGLICVRRSRVTLDMNKADEWFQKTARGQKYDFLGLLCFMLAVKRGSLNRMYCSEFWTRWMRRAGSDPFNPDWDADRVPPSFCYSTNALWTVWQTGNLF